MVYGVQSRAGVTQTPRPCPCPCGSAMPVRVLPLHPCPGSHDRLVGGRGGDTEHLCLASRAQPDVPGPAGTPPLPRACATPLRRHRAGGHVFLVVGSRGEFGSHRLRSLPGLFADLPSPGLLSLWASVVRWGEDRRGQGRGRARLACHMHPGVSRVTWDPLPRHPYLAVKRLRRPGSGPHAPSASRANVFAHVVVPQGYS